MIHLMDDYEPDYDAYIRELESLEAIMANVETYDDWFPEQEISVYSYNRLLMRRHMTT